ncbi:MAG: RdgB/HAM1 family non-canonical purine NTP pyrophosphatase [Bacteroidia bacterium]|nr:RdgB/HAM1 family non-canonical purine NTP pyrophosphatase [Bacteroidia bacterium]
MQLVLATQNRNKAEEIKPLLPPYIQLLLPEDLGFIGEIPETADTLEENAVMKARFIFEMYHVAAFADDTGLEVNALGGKPGVYSARYAGMNKNADKNIAKLLLEMQGVNDRRARFRTVIALVENGSPRLFEGTVSGTIAPQRQGVKGFGYDPVFIPSGSAKSFAQMSLEEKNRISHRAMAIERFAGWMKNRAGH